MALNAIEGLEPSTFCPLVQRTRFELVRTRWQRVMLSANISTVYGEHKASRTLAAGFADQLIAVISMLMIRLCGICRVIGSKAARHLFITEYTICPRNQPPQQRSTCNGAYGASDRTRTCILQLTKMLHNQLCYASTQPWLCLSSAHDLCSTDGNPSVRFAIHKRHYTILYFCCQMAISSPYSSMLYRLHNPINMLL